MPIPCLPLYEAATQEDAALYRAHVAAGRVGPHLSAAPYPAPVPAADSATQTHDPQSATPFGPLVSEHLARALRHEAMLYGAEAEYLRGSATHSFLARRRAEHLQAIGMAPRQIVA